MEGKKEKKGTHRQTYNFMLKYESVAELSMGLNHVLKLMDRVIFLVFSGSEAAPSGRNSISYKIWHSGVRGRQG